MINLRNYGDDEIYPQVTNDEYYNSIFQNCLKSGNWMKMWSCVEGSFLYTKKQIQQFKKDFYDEYKEKSNRRSSRV